MEQALFLVEIHQGRRLVMVDLQAAEHRFGLVIVPLYQGFAAVTLSAPVQLGNMDLSLRTSGIRAVR